VLNVRVVIYPRLIREEIVPELRTALFLSISSILGSMVIAFLFSNVAFRPLGKLTQMLDHLTRGDYEQQERMPEAQAAKLDEFGEAVSKVTLLGQQLGNFDRLIDQLEEAVFVFGPDRT